MSQRRIKAGAGVKKARKAAAKESLRRRRANALPPGVIQEGIRAGTYTAVVTGPAAMVPYVQDGELRTQVRDLGTRKDVSFSQDEASAVNPCIQAVTFILSQFHGADTEALMADKARLQEALETVTFNVREGQEDTGEESGQEESDGAQTGGPEGEDALGAP